MQLAQLRTLIAVAQGHQPADLLFHGGQVVNVFTGELEAVAVAIVAGQIAGLAASPNQFAPPRKSFDLAGRYLAPSFIDAHIHLESTQLWVDEFARIAVAHGTGTVVADPHEIANVLGQAGVQALIDGARNLPLNTYFVAPSCVPASARETSGATLDAAAVAPMLDWPAIIGLGEMMNFPGVLAADEEVLTKLTAAQQRNLPIDGHAPGVGNTALNAYAAAGISADHESTTLEEAREKLRRGLTVMIREGSTARNLQALLPLVTPATASHCTFVSDDREAVTLLDEGHLDAILRQAVAQGLDPFLAIRLVTLNPARFWRLPGLGAVAPGYYADLVVLDDLHDFHAHAVFHRGKLVARDGEPLFAANNTPPALLRNTVHLAPLTADSLRLPATGQPMTIVGAIPGQIVTERIVALPTVEAGEVVADPSRDLLKIAVVERHHATGNIGVGLLHGFGLQRGAIASSVGHDAHNITAIGTNDRDMLAAIAAIAAMGGGIVAVADGATIAALPLPLAGLLSDQPINDVAAQHHALEEAARTLGCTIAAPFALLSFMPLSVIPAVRITDQGLVEL